MGVVWSQHPAAISDIVLSGTSRMASASSWCNFHLVRTESRRGVTVLSTADQMLVMKHIVQLCGDHFSIVHVF